MPWGLAPVWLSPKYTLSSFSCVSCSRAVARLFASAGPGRGSTRVRVLFTIGGNINSSLGNDMGHSLQEVRCVFKTCAASRRKTRKALSSAARYRTGKAPLTCEVPRHSAFGMTRAHRSTHTLGSPAELAIVQIQIQHLGALEPPHRLLDLRPPPEDEASDPPGASFEPLCELLLGRCLLRFLPASLRLVASKRPRCHASQLKISFA